MFEIATHFRLERAGICLVCVCGNTAVGRNTTPHGKHIHFACDCSTDRRACHIFSIGFRVVWRSARRESESRERLRVGTRSVAAVKNCWDREIDVTVEPAGGKGWREFSCPGFLHNPGVTGEGPLQFSSVGRLVCSRPARCARKYSTAAAKSLELQSDTVRADCSRNSRLFPLKLHFIIRSDEVRSPHQPIGFPV